MATNIISYFFNFLFPLKGTKEEEIIAIDKQVLGYCIFILVLIVMYFLIFLKFGKNHRKIIDSEREKEIERLTDEKKLLEDSAKGMSEFKIIF